jgi:CDP-diacylglycerol--glycerol-3-phosphate 3-phosphatidyltransferase
LTATGPARTVRSLGRVIEGTAIDLYRVKPAILRGLEPLLARLERTAVSPDALTLAAIPISALAGVAILVSPAVPTALLFVPAVAGIRLLLNLLDGALARRTARTHPRGAFYNELGYNELGDRSADVLMLAPVAFVPGAIAPTVWLGVVFAVLASFTSVATQAAGGERSYRGILSKPGRLALLSGFAIAALIVGPAAWGPFGPVLALGTFLTLAERVMLGIRSLP